jgi:hypothetical protein
MNLIERIARHADIDTRRAMGFPPRRLVAPDLHLKFPCVREAIGRPHEGYGPRKPLAQQNLNLHVGDTTRRIYNYMYEVDLNNGLRLDIYHTHETWYFYETLNPGNFRFKAFYTFVYDSKVVRWCDRWGLPQTFTHPDFDEGGTLKSWQSSQEPVGYDANWFGD